MAVESQALTSNQTPLDEQVQEVVTEIEEQRRRHRRRRQIVRRVGQLVLLLAFFGGWQLFAGDPESPLTLVDEFYVSRPSIIVDIVIRWIVSGEIVLHMMTTLQETVVGFGIGASLGMATGLLLGSNKQIGDVVNPFVTAVYSIPRLALVPLFVLWFGIGIGSKLVFVSMVVFFLVFFNSYSGAKDVSPDLVNVLKVMGATRRDILRKVIIPSAMVWILTGLRVSVPYALVAAVTAEIVSSNRGLGFLLVRSANQFFVEGVFAAIVFMVAVSLTLTGLIILVDRHLMVWKRPSGVGE